MGLARVVGRRRRLQREVHHARDDAARRRTAAEAGGLVRPLAIERVVDRQPHPLVAPRRLGIPLVGELDPENGRVARARQRQARVFLHRFRVGPVEGEGEIRLAALEHRQPSGAVWHALERQALDVGHVPPVPGKCLEHDVDAGTLAHEPVGARADGLLLEAVSANLLEVLPRQDDAGGRGGRPVEGHEIRPGLLENEADRQRIDRLHLAHPSVELLGACALVALEAPLDVVGRQRVAVVELESLAELELVDEPVGTFRPRLGQAGSHLLPRERADQRVVDGVEDAERRDLRRRGGRIEPGGRQRDMEGDRDLARRGLGDRRLGRDEEQRDRADPAGDAAGGPLQ